MFLETFIELRFGKRVVLQSRQGVKGKRLTHLSYQIHVCMYIQEAGGSRQLYLLHS